MDDALINNNKEGLKVEKPFAIVAIGASAGGIEAVLELVSNLPATTGMAYVYIQHLDPDYKSSLVEIVQREAQFKVEQATDQMLVQPDHLYIIPPNSDMEFKEGRLRLYRRGDDHIQQGIDLFFLSLAENQQSASIGIILSGTSSDGTAGLKAIKKAGGFTFVQDASAKFESMPKSAMAEEAVDAVLSPKEIAKELTRISRLPAALKVVLAESNDEDVMPLEVVPEEEKEVLEEDISPIISLIKIHSGIDFHHYKQTTIRRRILRRMVLLNLDEMQAYVEYLKKNLPELHILSQDMLINVTHFFRDEEAVDYLQTQILPKLIQSHSAGNPLRIWVPACSTGEEAYSLAMLIMEVSNDLSAIKNLQIFATDISEASIAKARVGIYSATDVINVSPERLEKFFMKVDGHYRVIKTIRNVCVFAPHNIFKDPPFSHVDLISCCNLMIYLDMSLQKKILQNFHYALNKNGYLVLGKSETVAAASELFAQLAKKTKIFSRKNEVMRKAVFDLNYNAAEVERERVDKRPAAMSVVKERDGFKDLEKEVDTILLNSYVPAGVVVNHDLDIIQFRGSTSLFLEPSPGKASLNLLKMVRLGLALELRNATHKVITTGEPIKKTGIEINYKGNIYNVGFEITPLDINIGEKLMLIIFEETKMSHVGDVKASSTKDRRVKQLEAELVALRQDLSSIVEAQEAANEELQSANEEIVSSNEELQSINEELETSKEELESSNEELLTINRELLITNEQLSEAQHYTEALITTIREAVLVLDLNLRVKRANTAFYNTFNVRDSEMEGRLLYEISNGQWNIRPLREKLEKIIPYGSHFSGLQITHNFAGLGEKVMLMNARVVIQKAHHLEFILLAVEDITEHKQAEKLLEEREAWIRGMANNVPIMIWVAGVDKNFTFLNNTWLEFTGRTLAQETGIGWTEGVHPQDLQIVLSAYHSSFQNKQPINLEYRMKRHDGEYRWVLNRAVPTFDANGVFSGYTGSCTEIHDKRIMSEELENRVEERTRELRDANQNLERSNDDLAQFAYVASHDLQEPLRKIITFSNRLKERFGLELPDAAKEFIEKINFSSERMRQLIDDLLNFSRISKFDKKFTKTDLNKVLQDVLIDFDLVIHEKKAIIHAEPLPIVDAIPLQMNQLFYNLLGNAFKFIAKNVTPEITISCRTLEDKEVHENPRLESEKGYYKITIADNGIGFNPEFSEQIFVIFQRLHEKEEYSGNGIGLALCQKIVNNHGGVIFAEGEEGKGAKFNILLPL